MKPITFDCNEGNQIQTLGNTKLYNFEIPNSTTVTTYSLHRKLAAPFHVEEPIELIDKRHGETIEEGKKQDRKE